MSRPRARRERGFSLIIVFLLTMVMVGVAATVALSTQQDLSVSGQDREAKMAFYAAEYAVALGKDFLSAQNFDKSSTGWTALLIKNPRPTELCQLVSATAKDPGVVPAMAKAKYFTLPGGADEVQYQFCIHNDVDDPGYLLATPNGETSDTGDPNHFVTIEGYGFYGGKDGKTPLAQARIAATVGAPKTSTVLPAGCYSQEGGCGQHLGNAGALEAGLQIDTTKTKGF